MALAEGSSPVRNRTRACIALAGARGDRRGGGARRVMEPIVLDEYDSAVVSLTADEVASLRVLTGPRLSVTAADTPGDWIIRATAHVGTIVLGSVRVLVRPKVSNANLFHLLEAGGDALSVRPEAFEYDHTGDLVPSFATFFARVA